MERKFTILVGSWQKVEGELNALYKANPSVKVISHVVNQGITQILIERADR